MLATSRLTCYDAGMDDYMTVTEAAGVLGLSVHGVRSRIERGELKAERVNPRLWLIPRAEVERHQQIGRMKPGPAKGTPRRRKGDDTEGATP